MGFSNKILNFQLEGDLRCSVECVPVLGAQHRAQAEWIEADFTLGTSSTHLRMPHLQFINIYHQDLILTLISPTVKDTSEVRNVIHYFAPDAASTVGLLSRFIAKETKTSND